MSTRSTLIVSSILIVIGLLAGLLLWNRLPEQLPAHWNVNDQVDGYMPKLQGVLLMPLVTAGMLLLFMVVPAIDPLKANIARFRTAFNLFILVLIAFMLYIHGLTLAWGLGYHFGMSRAMLPLIGVVFLVTGWMMRSAKRNFFIGIRTPWTLSSDRVWEQTHRMGSILFILCGLLAMLSPLFGGVTAFWLLLVPVIVSSVFLMVYSYVLYRAETRS